MAYSNSSLVAYTRRSPNHSGMRKYPITRISIHCVVGQVTAEALGALFASSSVQASSNYGVDKNGRIGLYVDECNRSWCTSDWDNDNRAITIETASDAYDPYKVTDAAYKGLINLIVDICKRNGKNKLVWFGNKSQSLNYNVKSNELMLTVHRWFANKSCPGDYLYNLHPQIVKEVNAILAGSKSAPSVPQTNQNGSTNGGSNTVTVTFNFLAKSGYTSSGKQVKTWQRLMNAYGYKGKDGKALTVDGEFGANTDYATRAFQKAEGLEVDGIVGTNSWKKALV